MSTKYYGCITTNANENMANTRLIIIVGSVSTVILGVIAMVVGIVIYVLRRKNRSNDSGEETEAGAELFEPKILAINTKKRWKPYEYTPDDRNWMKLAYKTERDMCQRHLNHVFTEGKNDDYPGCLDARCCARLNLQFNRP